jgi:methyl-accepting chemotaxis protein
MAYKEDGTLTLRILAQDLASGRIGAFLGHLDQMARKGGLVGSVLQGVGQSFGQMLDPVALVGRGIGMVTEFLGGAAMAAAEEEAAIARLTAAVEANDSAWDGNVEAIEEVIESRLRLAFSDDEQRDSLTRLVAVTKDHAEALRLSRQAMDLARLRGIDLATASDLIGKVYAGNTGILSRYGIQLERGVTATEALAEIQRRAAGQAETYADTALGSFASLRIELDDITEDIGQELLPVMRDLAVVVRDQVVPQVKALTGAIDDVLTGVGMAFDPITTAVRSFEMLRDAMEGNTVNADLVVLAFGHLADEMGMTAEQFRAYAERAAAANLPMANFVRNIEGRIGVLARDREAMEATGEAMGDLATETDAAVDSIVRSIDDLGPSLRDTIREDKDRVRAAMQDLRWAMEHPFAGERYADWLRDRQAAANRKLVWAIRSGKRDAAAEARALVNAVQLELARLGELPFITQQGSGFTMRVGLDRGARKDNPRGMNPMYPGDAGWVGEHGREWLSVTASGATVTPAGPREQRSSPAASITLVYAPQFSTASEAEAQRFMDRLGPSIVRWMRGQRLAPGV